MSGTDIKTSVAVSWTLLKTFSAKALRAMTKGVIPPAAVLAAALAVVTPFLLYGLVQTHQFGRRSADSGMELILAYFGASFYGTFCICIVLIQIALFSGQLDSFRKDLRQLPLSSTQITLTTLFFAGAPTIIATVMGLGFVLALFAGVGSIPTGTLAALTSGAASTVLIWVAVLACGYAAGRLLPQSLDVVSVFSVIGALSALTIFWLPLIQMFSTATIWPVDQLPDYYPSKLWLIQSEEIAFSHAAFITGISLLSLCVGAFAGGGLIKGVHAQSQQDRVSSLDVATSIEQAQQLGQRMPSWALARLGAVRLPWFSESLLFSALTGACAFIGYRIAVYGNISAAENALLAAGVFCTIPAAKAPGSIFPQHELQKLGVGPAIHWAALAWAVLLRASIPVLIVSIGVIASGQLWMLTPMALGLAIGLGAALSIGRLMAPTATSTLGLIAINGAMSLVALVVIMASTQAVPMWAFAIAFLVLGGVAIFRKDERLHVAH